MKRKGITPVIAVVLLLLITVGAVGAAFGLFQQLQSQAQGQQEQFSAAQRAANTDFQFVTVERVDSQTIDAGYLAEDTTNFTIRNTGERAVGLDNEIELQIQPQQESDPISISSFSEFYGGDWNAGDQDNVVRCFQNADVNLPTQGPNNTFECATNITFPDPGESITFAANYEADENTVFTYTCNPSGAGRTC